VSFSIPLKASACSSTPGLLLTVTACAHPWLEQTMARHMGLELPALFLLGWFAAASAGNSLSRAIAPWNVNGLPGMLFALSATGFWMVPAALDAAVLHVGMATVKVASLVAAGALLRASWSCAGLIIQAFFVLNWFWMTLAAGLLYQEAPQQLCSVYLVDQQSQAGKAVVIWAMAGLGAWLWRISLTALSDDALPPVPPDRRPSVARSFSATTSPRQ
jgi:hypothetical protein